MKKRNKWKSWKYTVKYSSVRGRIKRKTHKRDRFVTRIEIAEEIKDL
jgi:hypothetical protein